MVLVTDFSKWGQCFPNFLYLVVIGTSRSISLYTILSRSPIPSSRKFPEHHEHSEKQSQCIFFLAFLATRRILFIGSQPHPPSKTVMFSNFDSNLFMRSFQRFAAAFFSILALLWWHVNNGSAKQKLNFRVSHFCHRTFF